MTVAKPVTNPEQDLAIREMILGVLKAKDSTGRNVVHSSDFRTAITDLGFPMGSMVIENILVHCKIDNKGNLDFTQLEKELTRERRVFNSQKKIEKPMMSTSTGVVSKPWRGDEIHQAKVAAEQQLNKLTEHNPIVHEIYNELSHHRMNPSDAITQLEGLEIYPTKEFIKLLRIMTFNDVSFSQFVKALTKSDPNAQDLDDLSIPAGNRKPKPADTTDIIGLQRKRSTSGMKTAFHESADLDIVQKPIRKMVKDGTVNDATIFKAEQIKKTLFCDSEPVSLLSHNQHDMVAGTIGTKDIDVAFNVETKVQREQVLAALRKLDVGAISMDDFQDMLFSIGVDLPEALAVDIRRSVVSGRMDVKKYVKLLDASIFKHAAIEERITRTEVQNIKQQYIRAVCGKGLDAFLDLSQVFRDLDQDGDGKLTFSEFKKGCEELNLMLGETELRLLFHSFDKNGDGVLQYEEFLDSIRGSFSAARATWIRRAFQKLDRHGQGGVSIDIVADSFDPQGHPNVLNGSKSAREVASEFVRWFTNEPVRKV
jgi:Ca2+-binding EF-hand superfamily protein